MGIGRVRFSPKVIERALQFPVNWEIRSIETEKSSRGGICLMVEITGPEFPSTIHGDDIKECALDITDAERAFKVRVI